MFFVHNPGQLGFSNINISNTPHNIRNYIYSWFVLSVHNPICVLLLLFLFLLICYRLNIYIYIKNDTGAKVKYYFSCLIFFLLICYRLNIYIYIKKDTREQNQKYIRCFLFFFIFQFFLIFQTVFNR